MPFTLMLGLFILPALAATAPVVGAPFELPSTTAELPRAALLSRAIGGHVVYADRNLGRLFAATDGAEPQLLATGEVRGIAVDDEEPVALALVDDELLFIDLPTGAVEVLLVNDGLSAPSLACGDGRCAAALVRSPADAEPDIVVLFLDTMEEIAVAPSTQAEFNASIATIDGRFFVAFSRYTSLSFLNSPRPLAVMVSEVDDGGASAPVEVSTQGELFLLPLAAPAIAADASTLIVVWNGAGIHARRLSLALAPLGPSVHVDDGEPSGIEAYDHGAAVVLDEAGDGVVAWHVQKNLDDTVYELRVRRIVANAPSGPSLQVFDVVDAYYDRPGAQRCGVNTCVSASTYIRRSFGDYDGPQLRTAVLAPLASGLAAAPGVAPRGVDGTITVPFASSGPSGAAVAWCERGELARGPARLALVDASGVTAVATIVADTDAQVWPVALTDGAAVVVGESVHFVDGAGAITSSVDVDVGYVGSIARLGERVLMVATEPFGATRVLLVDEEGATELPVPPLPSPSVGAGAAGGLVASLELDTLRAVRIGVDGAVQDEEPVLLASGLASARVLAVAGTSEGWLVAYDDVVSGFGVRALVFVPLEGEPSSRSTPVSYPDTIAPFASGAAELIVVGDEVVTGGPRTLFLPRLAALNADGRVLETADLGEGDIDDSAFAVIGAGSGHGLVLSYVSHVGAPPTYRGRIFGWSVDGTGAGEGEGEPAEGEDEPAEGEGEGEPAEGEGEGDNGDHDDDDHGDDDHDEHGDDDRDAPAGCGCASSSPADGGQLAGLALLCALVRRRRSSCPRRG